MEEQRHSPGDHPPGFSEGSLHGLERQCVDLCPICRTADVVRATVPPEFQEHWAAWQREMLLAMRALLDQHIDRLAQRQAASVPVEDIPIE